MLKEMEIVEAIGNGKEGRLRDDSGNIFATFIKPDIEVDSNIFPIHAIDGKELDVLMLYKLEDKILHLLTPEVYTGKNWDFLNKVHLALDTLKITNAIIDKLENE